MLDPQSELMGDVCQANKKSRFSLTGPGTRCVMETTDRETLDTSGTEPNCQSLRIDVAALPTRSQAQINLYDQSHELTRY